MKILVLSSFTTSLFWFRIDMMKAFLQAGCEVVAVADEPEQDWCEKFAELGIRYRSIPVQRTGTNPLRDLKTLRALKVLLKEEKPDKIFAYQAKTVIYGGMAAKSCGIREFYPLIAGLGSVFLGNSLKTKLVRSILIAEYKMGMRKAPNAFFQNEDDLGVFVKHGIFKKEKAVMVNGSGVNVDKFPPMPQPKQPALLCISRLIRDKGVMEYLDACRLLKQSRPDVRCMLIGPFDTNPSAIQKEDLQSYIDDGSMEYFGEQKDVQPYLAQCSIYVLPSYHEGTPKTVLEAMATGRAILTTDAPGCRQTVTVGKNGLLVPVRDVQALASAMQTLLDDRALCERMGKESRILAEERYDVRIINQKILNTMGLTPIQEAT